MKIYFFICSFSEIRKHDHASLEKKEEFYRLQSFLVNITINDSKDNNKTHGTLYNNNLLKTLSIMLIKRKQDNTCPKYKITKNNNYPIPC